MSFDTQPVGTPGEVANDFLGLIGRIADSSGGGGDLLGVRRRSFTGALVNVTHGLPYPPFVWVVVNNMLVHADVSYPTNNTFRVSFSDSLTGMIYWR